MEGEDLEVKRRRMGVKRRRMGCEEEEDGG